MFKMFQYFESPSYVILLNSFYYSIFAFIEMLFCLICTRVCRKMCRIENITNFHVSLTFGMVKMFQHFESRSYAILLNSFYFSMFPFIEMLFCLICTWVCRKMCRIENITNFHGSLTFGLVKMFQYFESPESPIYAILLNSFNFSIFAFMEML